MNDSKGYGAITSAIVSLIGILAAMHPSWTHVVALAAHASDLSNVVPVVLTALGTVGAAISHPPAWLRAPWDRLKARLFGAVTLPAPPASDPTERDAQLARAVGQTAREEPTV